MCSIRTIALWRKNFETVLQHLHQSTECVLLQSLREILKTFHFYLDIEIEPWYQNWYKCALCRRLPFEGKTRHLNHFSTFIWIAQNLSTCISHLTFFFFFILIFDYELSPRESTAPVTFWISPECSEASYLTPIKPLLKAIMATIKQPCIKKNIFHNIIVPTRLYNSCRSQVVVRAPASTKQVDKILATLLDILSLAIYQNLSKKD